MRVASRSRTVPISRESLSAARRAALRVLLKAWNMTREIGRSPWTLAVQLEDFLAKNIRIADLHWLLKQGYVEHRIESTRLGSSRRTFRAAGPALTVRSCFILTQQGLQAARQGSRQA